MSRVSDLRVFMGSRGSGSRITATAVLNAIGLTESNLDRFEVDYESSSFDYKDAIAGIRQQHIDAFFAVSLAPFLVPIEVNQPGIRDSSGDSFRDLLAQGYGYVHPLQSNLISRMTGLFPLYSSIEIKPGTYPNQPEAISSIAVHVLLVATAKFPSEMVSLLLELISLEEDSLASGTENELEREITIELGFAGYVGRNSGKTRGQEGPAAGGRYLIPYHSGVGDFLSLSPSMKTVSETTFPERLQLQSRKLWSKLLYQFHEREHLLLFVFLATMFFVVQIGIPRNRIWLIRRINSRPFRSAVEGMFLLLLFAGTLTFLSEHRRSDFFSNPAEATFSVIVYLLSGFEDRAPSSLTGRMGSTIILVVSPLMIALLTGAVVRLVQRQISAGYVIGRRLKNHFVVCGWNDRALGIILQLRDKLLEKMKDTAPIVVVGRAEDDVGFGDVRERYGEYMQDVFFVSHPSTDPLALYRANVAKARAVIVLAKGDDDAHTALTVAALNSLAKGWRPETKNRWKTVRLRFLQFSAFVFLVFRSRFSTRVSSVGLFQGSKKLGEEWDLGWKRPAVIVESAHGGALESFDKDFKSSSMARHYRLLRTQEIHTRAIATAARSERGGLINALFDLLTFDVATNEMHQIKVSEIFSFQEWKQISGCKAIDGLHWVPFSAVVAAVYRKTLYDMSTSAIPVGMRHKGTGEFATNPIQECEDGSTGWDCPAGWVGFQDELLVMAYIRPGKQGRVRRWVRRFKISM